MRLLDHFKTRPLTHTPSHTGTVGLTEAEAIELHGADNVECYISSFAPLEWSITERHSEVSSYGKIVVLKHQNNKVRL